MYNFYVSKNGNDNNDGSQNSAFLTIERAQKAVRELVKKGINSSVKVIVFEGEYETNGFLFDARDSGTEEFSVIYEAQGEVILNGAKNLKTEDFTEINSEEKKRLCNDASHNVVKIDLKKYGLTRNDWGELCVIGSYSTADKYDNSVISPMWCELFVNDERMTIARYPNDDFLYTLETVREGQCLANPDKDIRIESEVWKKISNPISDIRKIDSDTVKRVKNWKSLENVWIYGYPHYGWADESNIVVSIDDKENTMETKYVSMFGITEKAPYYFYNIFEELDAPGEWFLDRKSGFLYLYPPKNLNDCSIQLSITTNPIISVNNAQNIVFRGFTITYTRGDAVTVNTNDVVFDKCEIKNSAGWAMKINGNNCKVSNCHIHHTGSGGIDICGGDRTNLISSGNVIINNHIHHIAEIFKTYNPGVKIDGVNCTVSHNCIHDSSHQAISFMGNDHIIEYNEIYNVCLNADDSGSVYSGRDYTTCGNIIRYNYFHDMSSEMETQNIGIFAIYCDDNLGATSIYGNIMHRCQSALLLHGGHDIVFKNNLIIDSCKNSRCSFAFNRYLYPETLVGNGQHIIYLSQIPWENDIWHEKYPHISEYLKWDPETEQIYPHFCDISNNIVINHERISMNFASFNKNYFNIVKNNIEISDKKFAGIPDGENLCLSYNRFTEIIPDFKEIPFSKMGIKRDM